MVYRTELPGIQTPVQCVPVRKVKSGATVRHALCVLTVSPTSSSLDNAVVTVRQVTSLYLLNKGYRINK